MELVTLNWLDNNPGMDHLLGCTGAASRSVILS